MHKYQFRDVHHTWMAYLLAVLSILLSFILWTLTLGTFVMPSTSSHPPLDGVISKFSPSALTADAVAVMHPSAPLEDTLQEPVAQLEDVDDDNDLRRAYALAIPSIGVRAPVLLPSPKYWDAHEWSLLEEQMQEALLQGLAAYPRSASPGHRGTLVVAGHSSPPDDAANDSDFGNIFRRLPEVQVGDVITVRSGDATHFYAVTDTRVVPASDTSILQQEKKKSVIRLITCYPVGTTKERFIVTAELQIP